MFTPRLCFKREMQSYTTLIELYTLYTRYLFFHFSIFLQAIFLISILELLMLALLTVNISVPTIPPIRFPHKEGICYDYLCMF
jgi:hypothetical protein